MSQRKVKTIVGASGRKCDIYWDSMWEEFQVKLSVGGKPVKNASYHTNDRDDAERTAHTMSLEPLHNTRTQAGSGWVERVKPGRINNPKAHRA